jgi:carboxylesterase
MADRSDVLPGAEPLSHAGGAAGVLVLHGFTGSPGTMRSVADALVGAGFTVELPRLPGHGTTIEDMVVTGFADWAAAAEAAYDDLAGRCERVVVVGLSMGGTLTCWLAARRPEVAGIVVVNPLVQPSDPEMLDMVRAMVDAGETVAPGIGSDIAKPDVVEIAYDGSPLAPALSMFEAVGDLQEDLGRITCPVLIMTSVEDHVVPPANSDHLEAAVAGPVERVRLERSYHVATMDHDAELVAERTIAFARSVTGGS